MVSRVQLFSHMVDLVSSDEEDEGEDCGPLPPSARADDDDDEDEDEDSDEDDENNEEEEHAAAAVPSNDLPREPVLQQGGSETELPPATVAAATAVAAAATTTTTTTTTAPPKMDPRDQVLPRGLPVERFLAQLHARAQSLGGSSSNSSTENTARVAEKMKTAVRALQVRMGVTLTTCCEPRDSSPRLEPAVLALQLHQLAEQRDQAATVTGVDMDPSAEDEASNDDECFECGEGGLLYLCETCPRSYHAKCMFDAPPDKDEDFICPECSGEDIIDDTELEEKDVRFVVDHFKPISEARKVVAKLEMEDEAFPAGAPLSSSSFAPAPQVANPFLAEPSSEQQLPPMIRALKHFSEKTVLSDFETITRAIEQGAGFKSERMDRDWRKAPKAVLPSRTDAGGSPNILQPKKKLKVMLEAPAPVADPPIVQSSASEATTVVSPIPLVSPSPIPLVSPSPIPLVSPSPIPLVSPSPPRNDASSSVIVLID